MTTRIPNPRLMLSIGQDKPMPGWLDEILAAPGTVALLGHLHKVPPKVRLLLVDLVATIADESVKKSSAA
jgi:hypothetical protein